MAETYPDLSKDLPPSVTPAGVAHPLPEITSLDDLRQHIYAVHKLPVDQTDPLLVMYTMHQIFLSDYDKGNERHQQALGLVISEAIKGLTEEALAENIHEQVRLTDRNQQLFEKQHRRMKILSALNGLFTIVCILTLYVIFTQ